MNEKNPTLPGKPGRPKVVKPKGLPYPPKKEQQVGFRLTTRHLNMALAVIIGFFLVFFPNIGPAITTAKQAPFGPSDAWQSSLTWLKENSPEPFGDPSFYYQRYEPPQQLH